jgi:hypothetical protein
MALGSMFGMTSLPTKRVAVEVWDGLSAMSIKPSLQGRGGREVCGRRRICGWGITT